MGPQTLLERIREWIGGIGWRLFLWGMNLTADSYWKQIYEQEKMRQEHPELFPNP